MSTLYLAFDTETSGLASGKIPLNHPSQPHLVSASALQFTLPNGHVQQSTSKVIIPDGWEWDDSPESQDRAYLTHLLSVEHCRTNGRTEKEVLDEILHLWDDRAHLLAHNLKFDTDVISVAIARYYPDAPQLLNAWQQSPGTCTMLTNKETVNARTKPHAKTGNTRLKNPNLKETYAYFFNEELTKHHAANADAVAVYQIFMAMQGEQDE